MRWVYLRVGRDIMYFRGWRLDLGLIVRPDLMRRDEEGFLVLAALWLEVSRAGLWLRSDANEIATRLAASG